MGIYASAQCDIRQELVKQYRSNIGIQELTGHNDGFEIEAIIEAAGFDAASKIPWCAASVYYDYLQVGIRLEVDYPAYSPSYFPESHVIYTRGKGYKCTPLPGDLVGFYYASKGRIAHIGIYDSSTPKYDITVEGNTNKPLWVPAELRGIMLNSIDSIIVREGGGKYRKYRPKGTIYKISRFL